MDERKHVGDARIAAVLRPAEVIEPEADVLFDAHMRKQGVALEDGVDLPPVRGQSLYVLKSSDQTLS